MCLIGFISGDTTGQGSTLTLSLFRNCRHILATRGLALSCRSMPLKERNSFRLQNLVNVTLSIEVALHNNEICFPSAHNATPYHNTPTSKSVPLNETIVSKTFPSSSKNLNSTVMMTKVEPRLIRELNPSPLLSPPTEMPLCPLQTVSPMTCCKHLSHIGPPWPNGLPGLPEAAQHCLFADTVLPCRTYRRLKTQCLNSLI